MAAMGASGTPSSRPDDEHEEPVEHGDEQRAGEVAAEGAVDDPAHLVGAGLARRWHHGTDPADDHLAVGEHPDGGDHHDDRGERAAEEALAEVRERLVVDAGGQVVDGLLDLPGGVGLLEPVADDRPAVEVADGGRELVAEVAGLRRPPAAPPAARRRRRTPPRRHRRSPRPRSANGRSARWTFAASGDRATPSTTPTASFVTMSGAIVTIAQIAAARAAAAAITATDAGWTSTSCTGRLGAATLPGLRAHRRYGTAGCPARRGPWSGARTASPAPRRSRSSARSSGWSCSSGCSSPPTDPSPGRSRAVAAAVLLDPIVDRLARAHPPGAGRARSPSSPSAPSGWASPTSCSTRSSRPSTGSRRRPRRRPQTIEDRDDRVGELARDFQLSDARRRRRSTRSTSGSPAARTCWSPPRGRRPPTSCAPSSRSSCMTFGPRMAARRPRAGPGRRAAGAHRPRARPGGVPRSDRRAPQRAGGARGGVGGGGRGDGARPARSVGRGVHRRRAVAASRTSGSRSGASRCSCSPWASDR